MAWETEKYKLNPDTITKGIEAVFIKPELGQYYVAMVDGKIVASLLTTYEWSDWRNATILWIQSVFVLKAYRRQGIFRLFYQHIKTMAEKDETIGGIRLYVDKTNIPAQKTYTKTGMNGEHYQLFEWMKA
jgi:GNAT superfamily N-acetyltransferase